MGLALQKSTNGGATFQQVSLSVADYTIKDDGIGDIIANQFYSVKDSQNNTYIYCGHTGAYYKPKIIKISSSGVKTISLCTINMYVQSEPIQLTLSRDEQTLFYESKVGSPSRNIYSLPVSALTSSSFTPNLILTANTDGCKFAIFKDQYIWVASGTTVKIYDYDTKVELATVSLSSTSQLLALNDQNIAYSIDNSGQLNRLSYNGISTITKTNINSGMSNVMMQLLIDRFGDLIILTNSGTASTLLKYSNTGTLIDTVNLSVGTNKGAYGLQVYSMDNGTKCWVQFSNDLGTWITAETTAQGQVFGAVSKIRDNGETTYGDDHGGDNNYSVRC